jgi:hypothetical protein
MLAGDFHSLVRFVGRKLFFRGILAVAISCLAVAIVNQYIADSSGSYILPPWNAERA